VDSGEDGGEGVFQGGRWMKVLGVIGSPRKRGNTHLLVERILEGAREGGAETERIFLGDLQIRDCDGCHACWKGKACSKRDDMNGVFDTLAESDAILFGTPVYWYGPTALMKAFVDRFVYFNCPENRGKIRGKRAAIAVPFEEDNPETAELVVRFFEKSFAYLEMEMLGQVIVPGVGERGEIVGRPEKLEEGFALGRRLAGVRDI
jgi:multimeric flavodoxin WrbA